MLISDEKALSASSVAASAVDGTNLEQYRDEWRISIGGGSSASFLFRVVKQ